MATKQAKLGATSGGGTVLQSGLQTPLSWGSATTTPFVLRWWREPLSRLSLAPPPPFLENALTCPARPLDCKARRQSYIRLESGRVHYLNIPFTKRNFGMHGRWPATPSSGQTGRLDRVGGVQASWRGLPGPSGPLGLDVERAFHSIKGSRKELMLTFTLSLRKGQ